ncbi:hypothetical protein [Porphyrobacter sp. YT40]|uniref:DUF7002 family protein n=1 Tax=Porphyrobacter sp. YT40 TaxID=2547601 RepID=UPI0011450B6E|nr:hypothetical protein [Porphyrobacter sp. YT40]QDH34171.1 hypothetical protein E2E27_07440 [Porphyrobacter sp. YT40]
MKREDLVKIYPRLYHMAHDGAWPAIRQHGLLSVAALLDLYDVEGDRRERLLARHRPESEHLDAEGLPGAVIRDQKPMRDSALEKCLEDGMTPSDWYRHLNTKSFFWLSRERVWSLLGARAYRDKPQTVLTVDTAKLVELYEDQIWLSPMNSGSTIYRPLPRGMGTFQRISDFPFDVRKSQGRAKGANVVELLVEHAVPDVAAFVLAVHQVENDKIIREIWRSPEAAATDHP